MRQWTTALPNWERRIVAGESLIPCAPLFPAEAAAALKVFSELRVVDVVGSPTMGEISRPWVRDFVASIFGAYDPDSGRRLIREWFLLISKKNAKSTTAAGIMLTALLLNWRQSGEFGILAPTIEVANNAFKPARDMIKADDELSALLHVQDHVRTITHRETGATLQVVAADSDTVAGKKWIVTLVDELWLFGKRANADKMLLEATGGMASRPEGFVIYLSTQSDEPPAGVFKEKLDYARGVRDGSIDDPEFLPVLYEFPPAMIEAKDYLLQEHFYITNPNLGASVDESFILRQLKQAGEGGAASLQLVLSKFLNVEIGLGLRIGRWVGANFWEQQALPVLTLDDLIARCEIATIGLDGGGLDDMYGMSVLGRERGTGRWLAWCAAWIHSSVLELRKSEASKFQGFQKDGDLHIVKRVRDDIEQIAILVAKVNAAGLLARPEGASKAAIGVDTSGLGDTLDALGAEGIEEDQIIGISQGWRLMTAIHTTERRLAGGELWHGGSALMNFCVGNAKTVPKGNAVMVDKAVSGRGKIDPLMALFNAVELLSRAPAPDVITADDSAAEA